MFKHFKKALPIIISAVMLLGVIPIFASADPSTAHVSISVSPNELVQEGDVSVSITLRNTNTGASSVGGGEQNPATGDDPDNTQPPEVTHPPEPTTPPHDGSYSGISISNAYGVSFETSGVTVPAGGSRTFTSSMHVTTAMIGTTLSFTVTWSDGGSSMSETVTAMITRANTAYLRVTRTATPAKASPGTTVRLTYTFVNTGSLKLVNITLVDRKVTGSSSPMLTPFSLDPGQTTNFNYDMVMGSSTVESAPQVTYYAYGSSSALTATVASLTIGLLNSQLTKEVVRGTATPEGVPFTIYLTNNGNQKLNSLVVKDELGNAVYGSGFSLAVGESKTLQAFIPNPNGVRYVVFKITGTDANGTAFSDNTESFVVRPYIDKSQLKLKFTAHTIEPLDSSNKMTVEFDLENTGSLPYRNLVLTEEQLGYSLHTWDSFESGASDTLKLDIALDGERELIFKLTAEDTSGNPYTFEAYVTASYLDAESLVPVQEPKVPSNSNEGVNVVADEAALGEKLDGLITSTGEKLVKWFRVLGIIAIAAAAAMIVLGISEIVIRRNNRSKRGKNA